MRGVAIVVCLSGAAGWLRAESPSAGANYAATSSAAAKTATFSADRVLSDFIDSNHDGRISNLQVRKAVQTLYARANTNEQGEKFPLTADQLRAALGADKKGSVSLPAVRSYVSRARLAIDPSAQRAKEFFASLDKDGDGYLTRPELDAYLQSLGDIGQELAPMTHAMFKSLDLDRDGRVSADEAVFQADNVSRFRLFATDAPQDHPILWLKAADMVARLDANYDNAVSMDESSKASQVHTDFEKISGSNKPFSTRQLFNYMKSQEEAMAAEKKYCETTTCPKCRAESNAKLAEMTAAYARLQELQ